MAKSLTYQHIKCRNASVLFVVEKTEPTLTTLSRKQMHWKYLLLLLSHFSCVRLCGTPETAAHQAPLSLGFSRQEHWSGLPFPSPMHESEKWKWTLSHVRPSATPWTAAFQAPPSMGFSRQEYWSGVPLPSPKQWRQQTIKSNIQITFSLRPQIYKI